MAKLLGIDFGTKRVGIAVTDSSGKVAFPKAVFPNDRTLMRDLVALVKAEAVAEVVVGQSTDKDGVENSIMNNARTFVRDLERETGVTIYFEPEYYSSQEVRAHTGAPGLVDAEAAAVILNSFLTKRHGTHD